MFDMSAKCVILVIETNNNKTHKAMTSFKVFANKLNGDEMQVEVFVTNAQEYFNFVNNYEGDDLGNDILFEDFVLDTKATGVIIHN